MKTRERRSNLDTSNVHVYAATEVNMAVRSDAEGVRDVVNASTRLNKESVKWYGKLGELRTAVSRAAREAGYAELGIYERRADGTPGKKITGGAEARTATLMRSPTSGVRGLCERFVTHMKVQGDTWLIRVRDSKGNHIGYDWVCPEEWEPESLVTLGDPDATTPLKRITLPGRGNNGTNRTVVVERRDLLGRVHRPGPIWMDEPDSPMHALNETCATLFKLQRVLSGRLDQRAMMNGIWFVPSEINKARTNAPKADAQTLSNNETIDVLLRSFRFASLDSDDPRRNEPIVVSGPGAQAENLRFIQADLGVFELEMKQRSELIDRLLFGLDINPQGVKGTSDANHWGAWAASDDEIRINVKPDVELMCWALEVLVMNRELLDAGVPTGRIAKRMVWYDLTKAQTKTNQAEDGREAFALGVCGPATVRRTSGINDAEAPTNPEYIRMFGFRAGIPELALYGLPEANKIDFEKIGSKTNGPSPDSTAPESKVQPGKGQPGSPDASKSNTPRSKRPA